MGLNATDHFHNVGEMHSGEPPPGYPPMATAYAQPMPQGQAPPMAYAQGTPVQVRGVSAQPHDVRARLSATAPLRVAHSCMERLTVSGS